MKIALALLVLGLVQAEKVTIKYQPKAGDKLVSTEKGSMSLKIRMGDQEIEFSSKSSKKWTTEYVEVVDGKPTKKTIDTEEDVEDQTAPGADEPQRKENPLHGKKITLKQGDGKLEIEGGDGLDDKTTKKLKLVETYSKFFPKNGVAVGDSWEITGADLKEAMDDADFSEGKVTCKLKEVKEIDKRKCAVISTSFDLSGKGDNDTDISMKLEGEMIVWLDRGFVLSMKGKGTLKMKHEERGVEGEGPMTVEVVTTPK